MSNDEKVTRGPGRPGLPAEQVERNSQAYTDIVARYYGDPDFKDKVDADPTRVLREEGLDIPDGAEVKLLFNTSNSLHLVLPPSD